MIWKSVIITFVLLMSALAPDTSGAPPAPRRLERVELPLDRIEEWPDFVGQLKPVSREEFERRWQATFPLPTTTPPVVIESATWEATLADDRLVAGTGHLQLRGRSKSPVWLTLSEINLAVSAVARLGSPTPVIWGAAEDGKLWIHVDQPDTPLTCAWSQDGRTLAGKTMFDLRVPPALSTTLRIRVPVAYRLESPQAVVRLLPDVDDSGTAVWEVLAGSETEFPLIATKIRPDDVAPLVIYRRQLTSAIREDHLRFEAAFQLEVLGGEIEELEFYAPSSAELYTVSWGNEVPLAWSYAPLDGPRNLIRVRLPDRLTGMLRQIRLEGIVSQRLGAVTTLPQIELKGGVFREGEMQVSVARPLQVVSLRTIGCRQESPVLVSGDGEALQFQQIVPASQVTLELRRPRSTSTVTAQVLSALDCDSEEWTWRSEILWSAKSGSVFQLAVRIPAGWEVTDVGPATSSGGEKPISWEVVTDEDGWMRIALELLEALTPERPQRLFVRARRPAPDSSKNIACPVLIPLECQSVSTMVRVSGSRPLEVYPDPSPPADEVLPGEISLPWTNFVTWLPLQDQASNGGARWFRVDDPGNVPRLTLYPRPPLIDANVRVEVETRDSLLTETILVEISARGPTPLTRLLVYLSEPGGDVAWEVDQPEDWECVSARIPVEHNPDRSYPLTGDLWELRLPADVASNVVIRGTRARPLSLPATVGLAFLPQARKTASQVSMSLPESAGLQTITRGLEEEGESADYRTSSTGEMVRHYDWQYLSLQDELSLVSRRASLLETPILTRLDLKSLMSAGQDGYDYHRAVANLPSYPRQLRFRFSDAVEILHAALGDLTLTPNTLGDVVVPPGRGSDSMRQLVLVYRLRQPSGFLVDRRHVPMPVCDDVEWTDCRWEFSVPPTAQLLSEPAGVRLTPPPDLPTWSQRLFGPLSRSNSGLFLPWDGESWQQLLPSRVRADADALAADGLLAAPLGWTQHVAYAPASVNVVVLETWRDDRMKLLSWLTMLCAMASVLAIRYWGPAHSTRWIAISLAICLGASVAVASPYVAILGGMLMGMVLGCLTPRGYLHWVWPHRRPEPQVPVGSTQSFAIPRSLATTSGILVVVLWSCVSGDAVSPIPNPDHVVVVPIDANGQPSPLYYVSPKTWEWLSSVSIPTVPSTPSTLIQRAEYEARLGQGQRVAVSARFEVLILGGDSQVVLPLGISANGLSGALACSVDGVPATITSETNGEKFIISWDRPAQPVSAIGAVSASRHQLQIDWQRAWRRENGLAVFDLSGPIAACSRLRLGPLPMNTRRDESVPDEFAHRLDSFNTLQQEHAARESFRVLWKETGPSAEPTECHVDLSEAWDLGMELVDVRSLSTFRPQTGAIRRLAFKLPTGSVVRRWSASAPAKLQTQMLGTGESRGELEFFEPMVSTTTVELDFVTPENSPSGRFRWSGLQWSGSTDDRLVTGLRLWSIAAPAEVQIQPESLEDSGLVPITLDSVRDPLSALVADRPPRVIYQVRDSGDVAFQTTLAAPTRRVLLWQQTGTLEGDRLKWEIEGELEVTGLPVYSHVLTVDRRLNIESISVRERGTERLARPWIESRSSAGPGASRIMLFLSDPAVETQRITLTASIPLNSSGPVPLPNVRCEDAQWAGGRLILRTPPQSKVVFDGARGLRELTATPPKSSPMRVGEQTRIFDQSDPDWRATIRVLAEEENRPARAVHIISSDDRQTLECSSLWRLPASRLREPATIVVPPPWDLSPESTAQGGRVDVVRDKNGVWYATVSGNGVAPETLLTLRLRLQRAALSNHGVLLPQILGAVGDGLTQSLAELTRLPQSPLVSGETPENEAAQPPDWGTGEWHEPVLADNDRLRWFELTENPPRFTAAEFKVDGEPVAISWVEHRLWCDGSRVLYGESRVRLPHPVTVLTTQLAKDQDFRAAVAAKRPGVTRRDSEGLVQISAADGSPFSEAVLLWSEILPVNTTPLGMVEYDWPMFPGASVQQLAVMLFPPSGLLARGTSGWMAGDWIDRSLLRLEILSDQLLLADGVEERALQQELWREYQATAKRLGAAIDEFRDADSQRRIRWKAVVDRVNQIKPVADVVTQRDDFVPQLGEVLVDHREAVYGMLAPQAAGCRFLIVERSWLRWLAGVLVTLVAWPVLAVVTQPTIRAWWRQRPNLSAAVLGLVWWLSLAPSIVGCTIMLAAGYRLATAVRPASPPSE